MMMFQELDKVTKTIRVLVSLVNRTRRDVRVRVWWSDRIHSKRKLAAPAFSTAFTRGESLFSHISRRSGLPNRTARFQQSAQEESRNCAAAKIVECVLCQGPHWARDCPSHHGGKGKRNVSSGKGYKNSSPFRQAYLEGDRRDWITGASAFAVWFPSLQNFASFDLQGKFILD